MTDITTIPTANLRFSTTPSSQKVSTSDYNAERQPQIAIWPAKPEIVIPLEIQQIASKFQRQIRDFRSCRTRIKCRQVIVTMTDNRKWQCGHQNRKYLYLWNCDRQDDNSNLKSRGPAQRNCLRAIVTTTDNRKWQYSRFECKYCSCW